MNEVFSTICGWVENFEAKFLFCEVSGQINRVSGQSYKFTEQLLGNIGPAIQESLLGLPPETPRSFIQFLAQLLSN